MKLPSRREHQEIAETGLAVRMGRQIRSLFDKKYRRAFRNLRYLPRLKYRCVIDGGASRGAFTDAFLQLHQPERLVLVEPIPDVAEKLRGKYAGNSAISVVAAALSDKNGEAPFAINRSTESSSLLPIDPRNTAWFNRDLTVARTIHVRTMSLPDLMEEHGIGSIDLLKLDLQGAERFVLTGSEVVLDRIQVIYTEIFFEQLYKEAWLFREMNEFLSRHSFKLCGLSNIVHATDGDLLQANATFRRV
jgi:FkbM family methyltransferase